MSVVVGGDGLSPAMMTALSSVAAFVG